MSTRASRGEQFTDVIKRYLVGAPTEVGSIDLASLRRRLDAAALLIEPALAARGIDAIALTKEKIGALGDCERFAAALLSGRTSLGNVDAMARGVLFETLVRSHVTRGVRAYRPPTDARATLELAVELVRAESADHNDDPVRARCLRDWRRGVVGVGRAALGQLSRPCRWLAALRRGLVAVDRRIGKGRARYGYRRALGTVRHSARRRADRAADNRRRTEERCAAAALCRRPAFLRTARDAPGRRRSRCGPHL